MYQFWARASSFIIFAAENTGETDGGGGTSMDPMYIITNLVLPFLILIPIFYFFIIRPQRKKEKETTKMRNEIQVGDDVTTAGGIVGRVVTIKDDTVTIETGADRVKVRIKKWAIQSCDTVHS